MLTGSGLIQRKSIPAPGRDLQPIQVLEMRYERIKSSRCSFGAGALALDHFIHDLLCSVDDFLDYRHPHQAGVGSERNPVRASGRYSHLERIAHPAYPRRVDGPVRRTTHLHDCHAGCGDRDLPPDLGAHLSAVPDRRAVCWYCRRRICCRRRLCVPFLSDGKTGHGAWHLRRGQCRRGSHKVFGAVCAGCLWLAGRCANLGAGDRRDGHHLLAVLGRRSGRSRATEES